MPDAPPPGARPGFSYSTYLKVPELVALQELRSSPRHHDEQQFILVHQNFELWFKLILWELDEVALLLDQGDPIESARLLARASEIARILCAQIHLLETMRPADFLKFRDLLKPASGFQSAQFREIEFAAGLRDKRWLGLFEDDAWGRKRLEARLEGPSLWDRFWTCLSKNGMAPAAGDTPRLAALVALYRAPQKTPALYALAEAFIHFDEQFCLWRDHHVRMVERMIGWKSGTGEASAARMYGGPSAPLGTHGLDYLSTTLGRKFFPLLWKVRTELTL